MSLTKRQNQGALSKARREFEKYKSALKARARAREYATRASQTPSEYAARQKNQASQFRPKPHGYRAYLLSPEWRVFRLTTLAERGGACEVCKAFTKHPQIHHLTYARLGKELPTDVVVTCDDCHRKYHGIPTAAEHVAAVKRAKQARLLRKKQERSQGRTSDPMPALAGRVGPKNEAGR